MASSNASAFRRIRSIPFWFAEGFWRGTLIERNLNIMKKVRQIHLYLGTLFAPLIIFFALTGILQTLNLHEGPGTPTWIAQIASVHKKQALQSGEPRRPRPSADGAQNAPDRPRFDGNAANNRSGPSPWPLKWLVVLMALGLVVTTILGIYMAFKYERNKAIVWGLLIAGTLLPIALLWV